MVLVHRQQQLEPGIVVLDTDAGPLAGFDDLPHKPDHSLGWRQPMPSHELLPHRLVPLRIHDAHRLDRQRFRTAEHRRVELGLHLAQRYQYGCAVDAREQRKALFPIERDQSHRCRGDRMPRHPVHRLYDTLHPDREVTHVR